MALCRYNKPLLPKYEAAEKSVLEKQQAIEAKIAGRRINQASHPCSRLLPCKDCMPLRTARTAPGELAVVAMSTVSLPGEVAWWFLGGCHLVHIHSHLTVLGWSSRPLWNTSPCELDEMQILSSLPFQCHTSPVAGRVCISGYYVMHSRLRMGTANRGAEGGRGAGEGGEDGGAGWSSHCLHSRQVPQL